MKINRIIQPFTRPAAKPAARQKIKLLSAAAILALCLVSGSQTAKAQLYNIDFGPTGSPTYTGAAVLGAGGDLWNQFNAGSYVGSPSYSTLFNATGSTSAGVQAAIWNYVGGSDNTGGTTQNPVSLMEDYIYSAPAGDGWPIMVQLQNLPTSTAFNLVVYAAGDSSGQGATITLADPSGSIVESTTGASRDISAGAGVAYQIFSGTTTASGTVSFQVANVSQYHAINGLQLQVVPEPSTMALGAGGLLLLGLFRLRSAR